MKVIKAYTDGSCLRNPGIGGYAAILQMDGKERVFAGYSKNPNETNNRMELKAFALAVKFCTDVQKEQCTIQIHTDSQYLVTCWNHNKEWLIDENRANNDIWIQIIRKCEKYGHKIEFVKIPGHSGIEQNERADKLAREMAIKARHILYDNTRQNHNKKHLINER